MTSREVFNQAGEGLCGERWSNINALEIAPEDENIVTCRSLTSLILRFSSQNIPFVDLGCLLPGGLAIGANAYQSEKSCQHAAGSWRSYVPSPRRPIQGSNDVADDFRLFSLGFANAEARKPSWCAKEARDKLTLETTVAIKNKELSKQDQPGAYECKIKNENGAKNERVGTRNGRDR